MNVELPERLRRQLADVAARMGKPQNECIIEALAEWLRARTSRPPQEGSLDALLDSLEAQPGRISAQEIHARIEAERISWER